jgi:GNAT superfamily N-acetyltransferase
VTIAIRLLADLPQLIEQVARLRWLEWHDEHHLDHWMEVTRREAGRDELPVTWVAVDAAGSVVGAVGLGPFDPPTDSPGLVRGTAVEERPELTPWVWGLVVRADMRDRGVGRMLLSRLERFAVGRGHSEIWVSTGPPAVAFYERCGWRSVEQIGPSTILRKPI